MDGSSTNGSTEGRGTGIVLPAAAHLQPELRVVSQFARNTAFATFDTTDFRNRRDSKFISLEVPGGGEVALQDVSMTIRLR
jgi:hypothetical protein